MNAINTINLSVVEDNRVNLTRMGKLFGRRIFKAERHAIDLKFHENFRKAEESGGLTTNRPVYRYVVVPIDIVGLDLQKGIDGSFQIVINPGRTDENGNLIEVRCPIDREHFTEDVTVDSVTKSLNRNSDSSVSYYSSAKKLNELVNTANASERARVELLRDSLDAQLKALDTTMTTNTNDVTEYYRQLDSEDKTTTHVTIEA